jgi:outer membrane receptor protein involved in Fe transport
LVALPTCGFTLTGNFGRAASKGAELEIQYLPMHELELDLSGAFNQAQLTEAGPGSQGTPGQELENAPRWSGAASAEYRRELGAGLKGFARLDINTTSYSYNNFDTTSIYRRLPGYSLANLRFGADMSHWRSTLFVTNLFNKAAETALPLAYAVDLPTTRRVSLNRPRTIGVDFRYDF